MIISLVLYTPLESGVAREEIIPPGRLSVMWGFTPLKPKRVKDLTLPLSSELLISSQNVEDDSSN